MANQVLQLSEEGSVKILRRIVENDGKATQEDAALLSLLCRVAQSQQSAAYPGFPNGAISDLGGALAHAAGTANAAGS